MKVAEKNIPARFMAYNSRAKGYFLLFFYASTLMSIFHIVIVKTATKSQIVIPLAFVGILVWQLGLTIKLLITRKPQIIIDSLGITSQKTGFTSWEYITNEKITIDNSGETDAYYLEFDNWGIAEKVDVTYLKLNPDILAELLPHYRKIYETTTATA